MDKKDLKHCIKRDKKFYGIDERKKYIYKILTSHLDRKILKAIIISRKYRFYKKNNNGLINKMRLIFLGYKNNKIVKNNFLELHGEFGENLRIYHSGIIIHQNSKIGNNVKMHGFNCIGNNGLDDNAPIIGNNVDIGIGATIIGNVIIADNITIGANSLVNKNFMEPGILIAGVPAKKIDK